MDDFQIENHGSVVMVRPLNDAARAWVDENVGLEDWQWLGGAFACEPRMVEHLAAGMVDAGFGVVGL